MIQGFLPGNKERSHEENDWEWVNNMKTKYTWQNVKGEVGNSDL